MVTVVEQFEKQVVDLFKKAKISAFSNAEINGFKSDDHENLIDNWFSSSHEKVKSILFFTFAEEDKINTLLEGLEEFNKNIESENPLRAVVLNIEKFL